MTNDSMQLPLLESSVRSAGEGGASRQSSRFFANKSSTLRRGHDRDDNNELPSFARFATLFLAFFANSFLIQTAVFMGSLSPRFDAVARGAALDILLMTVVLAEFYIVRSAAVRSILASHRLHRREDKTDAHRLLLVHDDEDGEKAEGSGGASSDQQEEEEDAEMDRVDGAFTVGSTAGCAAYVAVVHGWWAEASGMIPYWAWAAFLAAVLALGLSPWLRGEAREGGWHTAAKTRTTKGRDLEEC